LANPMTNHPFMAWLVANQAQYGAALDDQSLLEPNSNPSVGPANRCNSQFTGAKDLSADHTKEHNF